MLSIWWYSGVSESYPVFAHWPRCLHRAPIGPTPVARWVRERFPAGERLPVRIAKAFYDLHTPATLYNTWSSSELVVQTTIHEVPYPDPNCVDIPIGFGSQWTIVVITLWTRISNPSLPA